MSSDLSAEITAIATALLAVFAIITAYYARKAFREQSKEVAAQARMLKVQSDQLDEQRKMNTEQTRVLRLQADEFQASLQERKREAAERRNAQASKVFMWTERAETVMFRENRAYPTEGITAHLKNASSHPVYNVEISWPGETDRIPALMPGEQTDHTRPGHWVSATTPDSLGYKPLARFRDAAGVHWLIGPGGYFTEEPETRQSSTEA